MGLRDEQRELTRQKVLNAVLELLAEGALDVLSVPAVAKRSGVSVATIYRHFPTKDELITAAAAEPARRVTARADAVDDDVDEFVQFVRAMWREFDGNVSLLRHQLVSQAGRDMRQVRLEKSRVRLARYVESRQVDPESEVGKRLISMLLLVGGSQALLELHDHLGLDMDTAIDVASWGIDALIEAAQQGAERRPTTKKGLS